MAPTAITYWLTNAKALGSNFQVMQENGITPAAAQSTTGWIVGTTAPTAYSPQKTNTKQLASTFGATVQPDGALSNTNSNGWRSDGPLYGQFDAGNWVFSFVLRSTTAAATGTMRIRCRVFRSTSATAASAVTELTSAVLIGSTVGPLTTTANVTSSVTWAAPQFFLQNEYLFCEIACEIVTASGGSTQDALFRIGSTEVVTAKFNGITFRSSAATAAVSGVTSIALTKNAGVIAGDVLVAALDVDQAGGTVTGPAGWTVQRNDPAAAACTSWIATAVAGGAEPSTYTFNWQNTAGAAGVVASYLNVDNSNPVDTNTSGTTGNSTSAILPTFSSVGVGDKVVVAIASFGAGAISASTAGTRMEGSVIVTTDAGLGDFQMGAAGASGALTYTVPSAAWAISGIMLKMDTAPVLTPYVGACDPLYRM